MPLEYGQLRIPQRLEHQSRMWSVTTNDSVTCLPVDCFGSFFSYVPCQVIFRLP